MEVDCLLDETEVTANEGLELCPGESITLEAPTGYDSYTWSNGSDATSIEVSSTGSYSVISWQGDCASISNTVAVTVLQEGAPSISLQGSDIFCEGESAILSAENGNDYTWSNDESSQSISVTESGEYFVTSQAVCSDDEFVSESIMITVLDGADEPVVNDMQIGNPGSVDLMATGDNLMWYAGEFDTESIAEGDTYTTPIVDDMLTVWVEANTLYEGDEFEGGHEVADYILNGGLPTTGAYSYFNVMESVIIETVEVNVPEAAGAGLRTVQLVDENGVVLEETQFDLAIGTHTLELNFPVEPGNAYSLRCPENNLFRSSGNVNYPYNIDDVISIYDSFYGPTYYYYFYEWTVATPSWTCPSDRVEVTVSVVSVDEIEELSSFNTYPNPANNELNVEMVLVQNSTVNIELFDIAGRTVYSKQANMMGATRTIIPVSQYEAGLYTLAVVINGQRVVEKIIVE